jgi:hypothetical protein
MRTYLELIEINNKVEKVISNFDELMSKDEVIAVLKDHDKEILDALREREQLIIKHLESGVVGDPNYFEGKMAMVVEIIKYLERQP